MTPGRAWIGLAALAAALGLAIGARAPRAAAAPAPGGAELTIGAQLEPPGLDPTSGAAAAIKEVTFGAIYEGLVALGPDGAPHPALATAWRISSDGLTYDFTLRPGVRFHNGAPFDARAAVFSLRRALAPGSANAQRPKFAVISDVTATGPLALRVRLARPYSGLLQLLGTGDAVMVEPGSAATNAVRPVGTGPFRFDAWRRGESVRLVRNPDYWGRPARLAAVRFRFISDPAAAVSALEAGDVDLFDGFPAPEALSRFAHDPRFVVTIGPSEAKTIVALNNRRPPLDDVRVRRALAFAVDRDAIIRQALYGYGRPISSHYPPQDPGAIDLTGVYPHDPARARRLLAEAGHPRGLALTLKLPPPAYARRSGEMLAAQLAEAGVSVRIETVEWAQWLSQVFGRRDFDMTIVAHVEPWDYDIYGRDDYYFGYSNPEMKRRLAAVDAALAPGARAAALGEVQRLMSSDAINLYLFELPSIGVWRSRVRDAWRPTPVSTLDLQDAWVAGAAPSGAGASGEQTPAWLIALLATLAGAPVAWAAARAGPAAVLARIGALAATLVGGSALIFFLLQIAPGDPAQYMMGMNADAQSLAQLRKDLGIDGPAAVRYLAWIGGCLRGDFGVSYTYRVPVTELIGERLSVTAPLAVYAILLSTAAAVLGALAAAARPGGVADRAFSGLTALGVAAPNFWVGMLLILVFSHALGWLPAGGFPGWADPLAAVRALTLPAVALAAPQAAVLARVLRAELDGALAADFARTARAKGAGPWRVLLAHALPNALIPAITVLGLQIAFLLAGAVVVENVFSLPGLGRLIFQAVTQRDLIVVQGAVMLLVAATATVAFVVDLAYVAADPRLRAPARP